MNRWSGKKRRLVGIAASLGGMFLLSVGGFFAVGYFNIFHAHEHCSKGLGLGLRQYALDHHGQYPYHTNGFGDALLLLVKEGNSPDVREITAPGDDGRMYKECLEKGSDVPEEKCSRIYIQGLSESNAQDDVAMVFDKYPTRGGDHFRRPWGRPERDVVMSDGSVQFIPESRWPAFTTRQIETLVKLGFKRNELERLFDVNSRQSP